MLFDPECVPSDIAMGNIISTMYVIKNVSYGHSICHDATKYVKIIGTKPMILYSRCNSVCHDIHLKS